jgi:uncharacterized membrane-anchored protein YhcB (DUF1043 family)
MPPQMMSIQCPAAVFQRMQALQARKKQLEEAVESGSLTVESYVVQLDKHMAQDAKLAEALAQMGQAAKQKVVLARLKRTSDEKKAILAG